MKISELYACIISEADGKELASLAGAFAYRIERLEDGILFEISGLENLLGKPADIAKSIHEGMKKRGIPGNLAIASNAKSAMIQARNKKGISVIREGGLNSLPLSGLSLEADTLKVFSDLGFKKIEDLAQIPPDELISRYGISFREIIDTALNNGKYILTPNLKENFVNWSYQLDSGVADFEQLIFILRHGLEKVFIETSKSGLKTERIGITLSLDKFPQKKYEIKASFPTLDIKFWLKIIDLRISNDPPEAAITALEVTSHFARPRTTQYGLFSATKPQPESLLLTVTKIKKLVGEENAGVPVILDQRLPHAFSLDAKMLPLGKESKEEKEIRPAIALNIYDPPLPAEAIINKKELLYVRTPRFEGKVKEYSGLWRGNSQWWGAYSWAIREWDIELEDGGIYRLLKNGEGWFITGEYD